jgi:hypothetical protein
MHVRRLARKAVFITAAIMVLAGFSTGIAGTASAAPTSHVSAVAAVASVGTTAPRMLPNCTQFCTFDVGIRGLILLQQFSCSPPRSYSRITNPIFEMVNNCSIRVYWLNRTGHGCLNPKSAKSGVGRFGTVTNITTSSDRTPTGCR